MIISHKYKYLFIELPRTGTETISNELVENYGGEKILTKHATYKQFLKQASIEEKKYFTFSCIRNPIDRTFSYYSKYNFNYYDQYSKNLKKNLIARWYLKRRLKFIKDKKPDFITFLKVFYKWPYSDWSCLNHKQFNFIIRFENMEKHFIKVLSLIGVKPKRSLPLLNVTKGKTKNYLSIMQSENIKDLIKIFGPFMKEWEYRFPEEWGPNEINIKTKFIYFLSMNIKKIYWKYFKDKGFVK